MDKSEILSFLASHKSMFHDKYHVSKIGLFGSYAQGCQREDSDIDIIVSMPSDFDLFFDFKEILEKQFHKKVDLGIEDNIRKLVREQIEDEVIYV